MIKSIISFIIGFFGGNTNDPNQPRPIEPKLGKL